MNKRQRLIKSISDRADEICLKLAEKLGQEITVVNRRDMDSSGGCWNVYKRLRYGTSEATAIDVTFRLVRRAERVLIKSIDVDGEDGARLREEFNTSGQQTNLESQYHPIYQVIGDMKKFDKFDYLIRPEVLIWLEVVKEAMNKLNFLRAHDDNKEVKFSRKGIK